MALLGVGDRVFEERQAGPLADALEHGTEVEDVGMALFQRLAASAGNDPLALAAFLRHDMPGVDEALLGCVRCPVLVVLGERDPAGPAERLVKALPNATSVPLRGVDHFATASDFGAIDAVVEFLTAR